jgi:hypothetical protein
MGLVVRGPAPEDAVDFSEAVSRGGDADRLFVDDEFAEGELILV